MISQIVGFDLFILVPTDSPFHFSQHDRSFSRFSSTLISSDQYTRRVCNQGLFVESPRLDWQFPTLFTGYLSEHETRGGLPRVHNILTNKHILIVDKP
jgi:hypothetical protein